MPCLACYISHNKLLSVSLSFLKSQSKTERDLNICNAVPGISCYVLLSKKSSVGPDPDSMGSLDPYPDPDPGGQKWPTNIEKKNAGCSLLRAEGFSFIKKKRLSFLPYLLLHRRDTIGVLIGVSFNPRGLIILRESMENVIGYDIKCHLLIYF